MSDLSRLLDPSMSEENKAMVQRLVEAINAGEEEAVVEELFAPRAARRS